MIYRLLLIISLLNLIEGTKASIGAFPCGGLIHTGPMGPSHFLPTSSQKAAHEAITTDLYHGVVIRGERFSADNNRNPIYRVLVKNPRTGRLREALFKPRTPGDGNGWNNVTLEYVAYEIAYKLGIDFVPPAAYRKQSNGNPIVIGGRIFEEGALLYFVPESQSIRNVSRENWESKQEYSKIDQDLFVSDARVLDVLLQNPDRHINNYMHGRHWVDGRLSPFLIDHGASKPEFNISLNTRTAFGDSNISIFRVSTYRHLKALTFQKLQAHKEFLSAEAINEILKRKDNLIKEIDSLIESKGVDNVLFNRNP